MHLGLWRFFADNADMIGFLAAVAIPTIAGIVACFVKTPKPPTGKKKYRVVD